MTTKYKVFFSLFLLLAALLTTACAQRGASGPRPFTLTIVHSNDTHSYLAGRDNYGNACFDSAKSVGGLARMATLLKQEKARKGNVLTVDAGDRFQGTLFYTVNKWPMLAAVDKLLPYDAMTLGNHEFDEGCQVAADFVRAQAFPVVAANLNPQPGCPLYVQPGQAGRAGRAGHSGKAGRTVQPYIVRTFDGVNVGVVGLAHPDVVTLGAACPQTHFVDSKQALQKAVAELQAQGVRHIVAVTHLGLPEDRALARSVDGVDIIVGGHTHSYLGETGVEAISEGPYPVVERAPSGQPVLVVTAKFAAEYLGKLVVNFDEAGIPQSWNGAPLRLDQSVTPDPAVEQLVHSYAATLDKFLSIKVGQHDLDFADGMEACRTADCLAGLVAADAMLDYARPYGAELALRNGGGLRAPLRRGELNYGDILAVLPFSNDVVLREYSGAQVLAALEHGASGEKGVSPRLLQVAGLRYSMDAARPVGKRVLSAEVVDARGKAANIDPKKRYVVALLSYLARGGDGYAMLTTGKVVPSPDLVDVDIVSAYIKAHSPLTMPDRYKGGRIVRK